MDRTLFTALLFAPLAALHVVADPPHSAVAGTR